MRKKVFFLLMALLLLACGTACAKSFNFSDVYAAFEISDDYIQLTPYNLAEHTEWVAAQGTTEEELKAKWLAAGVLLQAWNQEGDVCVEVTAVKDQLAQDYFDLDQQTTKIRSAYRNAHLKGTYAEYASYDYSSAEWKKTTQYGRFLMLKYKASAAGTTWRGYARRTIRNGYTITVDYQVYGRSLKSADSKALTNIMSTWSFTQVLTKPEDAVADVVFTSEPPAETNTGEFTVSGTAQPGVQLVGVLMRMSSPDPIRVETTANSKGNFSMDVALAEEGVYLMTVTVLNGETVVQEKVFDTTTYKSDLLPVNLDAEIPTTLTGDKLVISGKTVKNVTIQCLISAIGYEKSVKTNGTGKFSFTIDTSAEGEYDMVLVFSKKNYSTRRYTYTLTRTLTDADKEDQYRDEAVKPAYTTLKSKLSGYTGRVMVYSLYVVSVQQVGDEWIMFMAMDQKSGSYRNIVVVTSSEDPGVVPDEQVKLYARCTGAYTVDEADGRTTTYPSFSFLFWD